MTDSISRRNFLAALGASAALPRILTATSATSATVTVTTTAIGAVGPAFAGLSYEKSQMAKPFFTPKNTDAIGLFRLIGPSLLRIGGNSVDKTMWNADGPGQT